MEDSLERNRDNTGENTNAAGEATHTDTEEDRQTCCGTDKESPELLSERGEEQGFFAAEVTSPGGEFCKTEGTLISEKKC